MPIANNTGELGGGSDGEHVDSFGCPFFHNGVKSRRLKPSKKGPKTFSLRLLPSFDYSIDPTDPAFLSSVAPYRVVGDIDPETGMDKFSNWYISLKGHEYVGSEMRHILSPLSTYRGNVRGVDPLYDIFLTAKNHTNPDWKALTEKPKNDKRPAVLADLKKFCAFNALMQWKESWEVYAAVITRMGMKEFQKLLNIEAGKNDPIVTPEWERFRFGDPTDISTGLLIEARDTPFGEAGMTTMSLHFSPQGNGLKGTQSFPTDPAFLEHRYNIKDMSNVTKITSAEEILDYIVSDGVIPYDLIVEACHKHWTIPDPVGGRTYSAGAGTDDPDDGDDNLPGLPPPRTAAPVVPARPATIAPVAPRAVVATTAPVRPAMPSPVRPVSPSAPVRPAMPTAAVAPRPVAPVAPARPAMPSPVAPARSAAPVQPAAPSPAAVRTPGRPTPIQRAPAVPVTPVTPPVVEPPQEAPPAEAPVGNAPAEALTPQQIEDYNNLLALFEPNPNNLNAEQQAYFMWLAERVQV